MMPVLLTPFGEGLRIGVVGSPIEHPGVCAIAGDALAPEVGDMLRERRRAKTTAAVAHDPGHDDDAPTGEREARDSAARRPRPKVECPPVPMLGRNVCPLWPAFFAANITSPTKVLGRLAARSP
jgi:hypothetical protein